jgi:ribulose-phosphate 3-epimerase
MNAGLQQKVMGLSVSLHCASQINMFPQLQELEKLDFDWYHIDITDGVFAPNFALGTSLVRELKGVVKKPLHVHLMTVKPEEKLQSFREAGADGLSFHLETTNFPYRLAREIKKNGMTAGVILTPITPVESLGELVHEVDLITIMSVEPGYSGQNFLEFSYDRIGNLKRILENAKAEALIEVDGGVDDEIAAACKKCGADCIVGGFYTIFKQGRGLTENYHALMQSLRD